MMILDMYITMFPLILGGIFNMLFVKTQWYQKRKVPIDKGCVWIDGKPLFGENKTYIGFISMVFIVMIMQIFWGFISTQLDFDSHNELYLYYSNTLLTNLIVGFSFGFVYMLFELLNSFIKRRLNIQAGKTDKGLKGVIFFVIDQIDSLIGVFFVLMLFNKMSFLRYLQYLILGGLTHIIVNGFLFLLKVRRNL